MTGTYTPPTPPSCTHPLSCASGNRDVTLDEHGVLSCAHASVGDLDERWVDWRQEWLGKFLRSMWQEYLLDDGQSMHGGGLMTARCKVHDVSWAGDRPCWMCEPNEGEMAA